ncbi:MAG: hypothetical protein FWF61_07015 [Brevinematales bacterium]|nr:hypothetical protein [Brevinematales bacterium]
MTKRDEAVFAKAFAKMEAKGCFTELRAKSKHQAKSKVKLTALKAAKKQRQQAAADSVSAARSTLTVPLAANKR